MCCTVQPALHQLPGPSSAALARSPPGRSAAGRVLPRRLHLDRADQRLGLHQQGGDLPTPVRGRGLDPDDDRRSEAPRGADWRHAGIAHLGLGADPPSARV